MSPFTSLLVSSLFLCLISAQCRFFPVLSSSPIDDFFSEIPPLSRAASPLKDATPALYVFGDSLVDNGNNNYLQTSMKADHLPFGIDFNNTPTGRFTNGRTVVDFIAQLVGLPFPPPYMSLSEIEKETTMTGVNYASASCGILPNTGKNQGTCLSFDKQIDLFKTTINDQKKLDKHLSESVLFISFGMSDFLNTYAASGAKFNPTTFGLYLSRAFAKQLKKLYELGGRKFMVTNVGPIGCIPSVLQERMPSTQCYDPLNEIISPYNSYLPDLLAELQSSLPGSTFMLADVYELLANIIVKPVDYGMSNTWSGCYKDEWDVCEDRSKNVFFDGSHPSQGVHFLLVKHCFEDSSICTPVNLQQLLNSSL